MYIGIYTKDAVVLSRIRDGADVDVADDDGAAESCDGDDADATSLENAMDAVTIPLFSVEEMMCSLKPNQ